VSAIGWSAASCESFSKGALAECTDRKQATSRYMLAAIVLNADGVKTAIRREIRRARDLLVQSDVIEKMLREQALKRDAIEGPKAAAAARKVGRSAEKSASGHLSRPYPFLSCRGRGDPVPCSGGWEGSA
jgi:hypothetical protein